MKILVYPQCPNPYQRLLYSNFDSDIIIAYLRSPIPSHTVSLFLLPFQLLHYRMIGYKLFHIHWLYTFKIPTNNKIFHNLVTRFLFTLYFIFILLFLKIIGFKIIWTAHDILPHEKIFVNDLFIAQLLSKISNAKIVLSESIIKLMKAKNIATNNTFIIPHGNYINSYKNTISRSEARNRLKINADQFVYLFLGRIEEYKGVDLLIEKFNELNINNSKLFIAGKCYDNKLKNKLQSIKTNKIHLILEHIPDNNIQILMNAADIIVFPFQEITTSGSVILALSFGKSLICPKIGGLNDLPDKFIFTYDIKNCNGLMNAMKNAYKKREGLSNMGLKAYKYAKSLSWSEISKDTLKIYKSI